MGFLASLGAALPVGIPSPGSGLPGGLPGVPGLPGFSSSSSAESGVTGGGVHFGTISGTVTGAATGGASLPGANIAGGSQSVLLIAAAVLAGALILRRR